MLVPLFEAVDEARHGGKAVQLGAALRAGLPVPEGFVLDHAGVEQALEKRDASPFAGAFARLGNLLAVRSSAIGEDSESASFAGQHATVLGVRSVAGLFEALARVFES